MNSQTDNQTVIGIFEKGIDAQLAAQKLESSNISSNNIDISNQSNRDRMGDADRNESDGVGNFFSSLFGDNDESRKHSEVARKGWIVTVHANSRQEAERAAEILDQSGAIDVDEHSMRMRNEQGASTARGTSPSAGSDTRIPIIEEKTNIGKRESEAGGVRLRSRIVERPVEENLRLREEHVTVERNPVNRAANEGDLQSFKEGEMQIRERTEVPIVNKEARVVEEIKVHKDTDVRNETIRSTERKTEVDVDKLRNDQNRDQDLGRPGQNTPDATRR